MVNKFLDRQQQNDIYFAKPLLYNLSWGWV